MLLATIPTLPAVHLEQFNKDILFSLGSFHFPIVSIAVRTGLVSHHLNPGVEFISTPGFFHAPTESPHKIVALSRFPATTCDQPRTRSRASCLKQRHAKAGLSGRLGP
jgi:hypothetical protein